MDSRLIGQISTAYLKNNYNNYKFRIENLKYYMVKYFKRQKLVATPTHKMTVISFIGD